MRPRGAVDARKLPRPLRWLFETMPLNRLKFWGTLAIAGLALAAVVWLGLRESGHHTTAEQNNTDQISALRRTNTKLAVAFARLRRLEHPTRVEIRAEIQRLLRSFTPSQAQQLQRVIQRGSGRTTGPFTPKPSPKQRGGSGGNGGPGTPSPPQRPPNAPPGTPSQPPLVPTLPQIPGLPPLPSLTLP